MKLAVNLCQFVQDEIGGLENYVRQVVGAIARDARFERVTIFALETQADNIRAFAPGAAVTTVPASSSVLHMEGVLARGYDLLFCPLLVVEPLMSGVPSAVMMPDVQHEFHPEFFSPEVLAWRRSKYGPSALEASVVFTLSEHAKDTLVDKLGLDAADVRVVHLDADEQFRCPPSPDAESAFAALGLPAEYLYCPANFWPHKNHVHLLAAFARLATRHPALALVLSGAPATGQARIEAEARRLGLANRVRFPGYLPREVVPEIYRHSRALVFPSLFEGFGIPILEAFHTATPVVTSRTTSCPEVAGDAALLVDPESPISIAEAVERVLEEPALRQDLVARGTLRAKLFSWKSAIGKTIEGLTEAAALPPRSTRIAVSEWPLVSIVTPSFNMAGFLDETITSVLSQDYPKIEYIVMDGGSTDGTLDILRRYEERLQYRSAPDGGQPDAINRGFELSHGEIFAFLNADDTYLPGAVSTAVRHMTDHPGAGVIYGEGNHVDHDGRTIGRYPTQSFDYELLNRTCYICQPASFMRRYAFEGAGRMDPSIQFAPDYDLWLRIGRQYSMLRVPEYLATSRMHRDNKTLGKRREVYREIVAISKKYFGYVPWDWVYGYACFLLDGNDQFFERPTGSKTKFLTATLLGCHYNRRRLRRFLGDVAREIGLVAFTGRWPDGWISDKYQTVCEFPADCDRIAVRGANDIIRKPLTLEIAVAGSTLCRESIRKRGPFTIILQCPPQLRATTTTLTVSADRYIRPFWRRDPRALSCRIESIDFLPAEELRCASHSSR